jgi:exosortase
MLGGAIVGLGLVLYLVACSADIAFGRGFLVVVILVGIVVIIWGMNAVRRLWFPLVFLLFMVPLHSMIIMTLNFNLKMLAVAWATKIAKAIGVMASYSGSKLVLAGGKTLLVGDVCSGLRTLISLIAFGSIYAYVCKLKGAWKLAICAMIVPVAVVSNCLRIVSLIIVAHIWDAEVATGWFHDTSGIIIFILAFLFLFGIEKCILSATRRLGWPQEILPLFHDVRRSLHDAGQGKRLYASAQSTRGLVTIAILFAAAMAGSAMSQPKRNLWNGKLAAKAVPEQLDICGQRMQGLDVIYDPVVVPQLGTTDYLARCYVNDQGDIRINMDIIFSEDNRRGVHPPEICIQSQGGVIDRREAVTIDGGDEMSDISCTELLVQSRSGWDYYLFTYKSGESYTGSYGWHQVVTIWKGLRRRNVGTALVQISINDIGSEHEAKKLAGEMMRTVISHVSTALP